MTLKDQNQGHPDFKPINSKPYMGSLMAPIHLTLSDLERSKSRSHIQILSDRRVVFCNIYIYIYILVVFDINLDVTLCRLFAGWVFRCPSSLSC